MHILYPNSPLRAKQPDEQFAAEVEAMRAEGFDASLFSLEDFQSGTFRAFPPLPKNVEILYRRWMLPATEYEAFASAIVNAGARPEVASRAAPARRLALNARRSRCSQLAGGLPPNLFPSGLPRRTASGSGARRFLAAAAGRNASRPTRT